MSDAKRPKSSAEAPDPVSGGRPVADQSYRVLARKYRPANFDDLIGQVPGVGTAVDGLLTALGLPFLGPSGLLGALGGQPLDVPLALPNGQVGGSRQHTQVCS